MAISRWQGFNSEYEHPTSTVLEHLEQGPGPGLCHMCWPGTWAWFKQLQSLGAKIAKVPGLRLSLNCRKYLKNKGHARGFFNPHPPDWIWPKGQKCMYLTSSRCWFDQKVQNRRHLTSSHCWFDQRSQTEGIWPVHVVHLTKRSKQKAFDQFTLLIWPKGQKQKAFDHLGWQNPSV